MGGKKITEAKQTFDPMLEQPLKQIRKFPLETFFTPLTKPELSAVVYSKASHFDLGRQLGRAPVPFLQAGSRAKA